MKGSRRAISLSGETHVSVNETACIWLHNHGEFILYVNIFAVNVAGHITLVNADTQGGIEAKGPATYVHGENTRGEDEGNAFFLPDGVPLCEAIGGSLVFILTENTINIRQVESSGLIGRGEILTSTLEDLAFQIGCGGARNYGGPRLKITRFGVIEIPFTLHSRTYAGLKVPHSQKCKERPQWLQSLSKDRRAC